jgi:hypothetical protein
VRPLFVWCVDAVAEEPEVDVEVEVEDGNVGKVEDLGDGCLSVSRSVLRLGKRRFQHDSDAMYPLWFGLVLFRMIDCHLLECSILCFS